MQVGGIQADHISFVWPYVKDMLAPAISRSQGNYTTESVHLALGDRDMQLWVGHQDSELKMAMITRIERAGDACVCHVLFIGGHDLHETWEHESWFQNWARANGADCIQCYARPGLRRVLRRHGYQWVKNTEFGALMFKDLQHA